MNNEPFSLSTNFGIAPIAEAVLAREHGGCSARSLFSLGLMAFLSERQKNAKTIHHSAGPSV